MNQNHKFKKKQHSFPTPVLWQLYWQVKPFFNLWEGQ